MFTPGSGVPENLGFLGRKEFFMVDKTFTEMFVLQLVIQYVSLYILLFAETIAFKLYSLSSACSMRYRFILSTLIVRFTTVNLHLFLVNMFAPLSSVKLSRFSNFMLSAYRLTNKQTNNYQAQWMN